MENVMIIGKLNELTGELYRELALFCRPQLCADSQGVIQGMLKLLEPDVVVASLEDAESAADIFFLLESASCRPPVVAVGSVEIQGKLIKDRYLPNKRVIFLQRPIKMEDVLSCVRGFLKDAGDARGGRKKILAVDDDPATLRTLYKMLSGRWSVSAASSGAEAVAAATRSKPDLILLDYEMPVMDGKMVLELLRAQKETADIPVVFLTGMSDPAQVENALALRPQGYLLKPPSEEKIVQKISSLLGEP